MNSTECSRPPRACSTAGDELNKAVSLRIAALQRHSSGQSPQGPTLAKGGRVVAAMRSGGHAEGQDRRLEVIEGDGAVDERSAILFQDLRIPRRNREASVLGQ
jgi:hypothetical protein